MNSAGTAIDYAALIERVPGDERAMNHFRDLWASRSASLFEDRPRTPGRVRVSDAGACALAEWADLHGLLDIPEDFKSIDSRMQPGILDGARTACLIAAGIARWHWPLTTTLEQEIDALGIPGHADGVVSAEPDPIEVFECKYTLYTKGIEDPQERHPYWLYQACRYALGVAAPYFVVIVHAPAVWNGPTRKSFRYATDEWATRTALEYGRLLQAEGSEPPEPDTEDEWRHKSCRYSQCALNVNPNRPMVETIVDEIGVI